MSKISEFFGLNCKDKTNDFKSAMERQLCPYTGKICTKMRKSNPETKIGTCSVKYQTQDIIICPFRLLEHNQIFMDCLHLLTLHEPNEELAEVRPEIEKFKNYAIYQPNTQALRGTLPDPYQVNPIGLCGGRLAEAIEEIMRQDEDGESYLQNLPLDEVLELIDWASGFDVTAPKKSSVNAAVPTTRRILEFQDRYLTSKTSFTAYDASEGALYVLFLLCLALHPDAPGIFAVDSFDHAMHPRLARETTKLFCKTILEQDKTVFVTTHNPLVLDGLDLMNDDIRLFAVNKSRKSGHTSLQRIQVTKELMDSGYSLSRLWTEGRLGGVPNL